MNFFSLEDEWVFVADFHVLGGEFESLVASGGFVGTFIVLANVSQKIVSSGVLDSVSVDTIGNNIWNVSVWWGKSFNLKGLFVL